LGVHVPFLRNDYEKSWKRDRNLSELIGRAKEELSIYKISYHCYFINKILMCERFCNITVSSILICFSKSFVIRACC